MAPKRRLLSRLPCSESFLIGILRLIGLIPWPKPSEKKRGRPYVYSPIVILRCFIVRIWLRIPSNNALHSFLSIDRAYNARIIRVCGLDVLPDRRTFDRRFSAISSEIRTKIDSMGWLFAEEKLIDPYVVSVDSTMLKAWRGLIWHKKSMEKNSVPYSGIDTDAKWGKSRTKGWVFGYKLHMSCSTGRLPSHSRQISRQRMFRTTRCMGG